MKKSTIVTLIVAASCIVAGLIVAVTGLCMALLSENGFQAETLHRAETAVSEEFHSISVAAGSADVVLTPADNGACRVVCEDYEYMRYTVTVKEGVLTVTAEDTRRWYEHIQLFSWSSPVVTVYLPQESYEDLHVDNSTGDITVPQNFCFSGSVSLNASTGDIHMSAPAVGSLSLTVSTGHVVLQDCTSAGKVELRGSTADILIRRLTCTALAASASTGDITAEDVQAEQAVTVTATSGNVEMRSVSCGSLSAQTNTGDMDYTALVVRDALHCRATTGDVTLTRSDATSLTVQTSTGDVTASLLTPKIFHTDTNTGSVKVPHSGEGGVCEITTDTGDIRITLAQ